MNEFIRYLNGITELSSDTQHAIESITTYREIPGGTILLRNGEICRHFHFLACGMVRVFYYKDGKEITAWFAAKGAIASAIDSLFTGAPSIYNIEVIEDAKVFSLQYDKLEPVFSAHPIVERLGRLLVTHNYLLLDERMKMFAFCTAEERYEILIKQFPNILNIVKLGHIASYLGITQEHLSRIRRSTRRQRP